MEFSAKNRKALYAEVRCSDTKCGLFYCTAKLCSTHLGPPPGPLCFTCKEEISLRQIPVKCSKCLLLYHNTCQGLSTLRVKNMIVRGDMWNCIRCVNGRPRGVWSEEDKVRQDNNYKIFEHHARALITPDYSLDGTSSSQGSSIPGYSVDGATSSQGSSNSSSQRSSQPATASQESPSSQQNTTHRRRKIVVKRRLPVCGYW